MGSVLDVILEAARLTSSLSLPRCLLRLERRPGPCRSFLFHFFFWSSPAQSGLWGRLSGVVQDLVCWARVKHPSSQRV